MIDEHHNLPEKNRRFSNLIPQHHRICGTMWNELMMEFEDSKMLLGAAIVLFSCVLLWGNFSPSHTLTIEQDIASEDNRPIEENNRPWVNKDGTPCSLEAKEAKQNQGQVISLVSYNVLGPEHGEHAKHNYTPMKLRKWKKRREMLFKEMRRYKADIYCLQEVTIKTLEDDWKPFFTANWGSVHQPKILPEWLESMPPCSGKKLPQKWLGVAIFYNKEKFLCLASKQVLIRDFCKDIDNEFMKLNEKSDAAAMLLLQDKRAGTKFVVVNMHNFFDPWFPDTKACQVAGVARALQIFLNDMVLEGVLSPDEKEKVHIIFCGDMNSVPYVQEEWLPGNKEMRYYQTKDIEILESSDKFALGRNVPESAEDMSAVYALLHFGEVRPSHVQHPDALHLHRTTAAATKDSPGKQGGLAEKEGSSKGSAAGRSVGLLEGPRGLRNLYMEGDGRMHLPSFTTKTNVFCATIDYLWGTKDVVVEQLLQFPENTERFSPVPNQFWGSDHLALGVTFSFR
uniref:Endonuclease/exonuclease/phosphatase domain-containing protein n=1 Tax=Heterosigma akashiwo TaxID=2829 RepID=A0A7S4DBB1_HETAK|mmetsp:Transcript_21407/g.36702  ORF Transcript_21407/g.36702 Transcript_21407/m.36702 type:complete len:510 (+) Transcript_21407:84-1613(+)